MTDYYYHEQLKKLNEATYKNKKLKSIEGWIYITSINLTNGLYCDIYSKNGIYPIVFRGTDLLRGPREFYVDLCSDIQMAFEHMPSQLESAREIYTVVKSILKEGERIVVTGYSLGGSLAQILGAETGAETVTFGAYGVKNLKGVNVKYKDNIINYGEQSDPVFCSNFQNHIGKRYVIPTSSDSKATSVSKYNATAPNVNIINHFLGNMKPLHTRIEYKDDYIEEGPVSFKKENLLEGSLKYNDYKDSFFDLKNRVFYKDELLKGEHSQKTRSAYFNQYYWGNLQMPTKEELDARVRTGELIYVESYTRSDGTKVSGYYRRYPRD